MWLNAQRRAAQGRHDDAVARGLWDAWQVAGNRIAGPARDLIANHGAELRDLLRIRNDSILAHGFNPVQKLSWERMRSWVQDRVLPVLDHHAREAGLKKPLNQLPTKPPEIVRTSVGAQITCGIEATPMNR